MGIEEGNIAVDSCIHPPTHTHFRGVSGIVDKTDNPSLSELYLVLSSQVDMDLGLYIAKA